MPPKKGKPMDTVDGVDTSKMNREQLEIYSHKIKEELEREREERNFFQLERDKLRTFWEITRHQLEEVHASLRNKEREKEELSENHERELALFKQKVKHLMYEHQNSLAEAKAEHMVALKNSQEDHVLQENELIKDKKNLLKYQKEMELQFVNEVRALKLMYVEEISKILNKVEGETIELENKFEQKLSEQFESLTVKYTMEISEVEERKNAQMSVLIKNHENAFAEIKNYYNDITLNNLSLIKSLKKEMEDTKRREERTAKQMREAVAENKKYTAELKVLQEQVANLTRQLVNYEKDKLSLSNMKKRLTVSLKDLEHLKWENEVLESRFEKCQSEREELHSRFVAAIWDLQQKTGLKNVLLEKKLEKLSDYLEQREAQINKILVNAELDPALLTDVNEKVQGVLNRKNTAIQDLQYELAKACKAHDDLLKTIEDKFKAYGITPARMRVSLMKGKLSSKIRMLSPESTDDTLFDG